VRPPLVKLSAEQRAQLIEALQALGFSMPGLAGDRATSEAERPRTAA
jgi:hypothetical protein